MENRAPNLLRGNRTSTIIETLKDVVDACVVSRRRFLSHYGRMDQGIIKHSPIFVIKQLICEAFKLSLYTY